MRLPPTLLAIVCALALVAAVGIMRHYQKQTVQDHIQSTARMATTTPRESGAMVVIETKDKKVITVPDFTYGHPSLEVEETGMTYVFVTQRDDTTEQDARYGITYASDSSVIVGLLKAPLSEARVAAEAKLRELIPVPDAILCTLKVTVAVPDTIEPRYAGTDVGLSFCPGAVPL